MGLQALVWSSALALSALVFVACGGGGSGHAAKSIVSTSTSQPPAPDIIVTASMFKNVNSMKRVGNHFVDNMLGDVAATLAVARAGKGQYPVGSVVQIAPQEAMVKHRKGFSPSTGDWEFFSLDVSTKGTTILSRGGTKVLNRFGDSCANCHEAAASRFDFICGTTHGCAPLPVDDAFFSRLQKGDPRPRH